MHTFSRFLKVFSELQSWFWNSVMLSVNQIHYRAKFCVGFQQAICAVPDRDLYQTAWLGKPDPLRGFSKAHCSGIRFQSWHAPCIDSCRMVVPQERFTSVVWLGQGIGRDVICKPGYELARRYATFGRQARYTMCSVIVLHFVFKASSELLWCQCLCQQSGTIAAVNGSMTRTQPMAYYCQMMILYRITGVMKHWWFHAAVYL